MDSRITLLLMLGMATVSNTLEMVNFGCPPDWYAYSNFCYKYNLAMTFTAQQAKTHCEGVGAQLLYLTSPEEYMFARAISSRRNPASSSAETWIGLDDKANEGTFVWSNGEILTDSLEFWYPGLSNVIRLTL
ncbi:C-type lectin domain family 4 member M [Holothuria leucospilota]|uniref:C-type lectin domain family 4 member M n=1 Tax=Holothuria leucospilota TaxID=206669 RepID=A0A9Q1CQS0_HOLLE|nr:C-type lectin domain family 4 member M [Holothuria leucospilota]